MSQEKLLQYIHHNRRSNTLLVQHNNKQIDKLRIQNQHNNKQIDQLRTEIDNIKAETSPLRQLMAENPYLIEQLRSLKPGEWGVDDIYSICKDLALVTNLDSTHHKADQLFERRQHTFDLRQAQLI